MRRAARRDENEPVIVAALRGAGWTAEPVSSPGFPDLVIAKGRTVRLMEIKAAGGSITSAQISFRQRWRGPPILTSTNAHEAIALAEEAAR